MRGLLVLTTAVLCLVASASAEVTVNTQVPFAAVVAVPCAGEGVALSGRLHILITLTDDGAGGTHFLDHSQPMGIKGTGLVSGDTYQGTGVSSVKTSTNSGGFPVSQTFINNFRIIGQGTGNNLLIHATIHVTVNENGDVTADVLNTSAECK